MKKLLPFIILFLVSTSQANDRKTLREEFKVLEKRFSNHPRIENCSTQVKSLLFEIQTYKYYLTNGQDAQKKQLGKINGILASSTACKVFLQSVYTDASVVFLEDEYQQPMLSMLTSLRDNGKLNPIGQAERSKLGENWSKKSENDKDRYEILGGYDCSSSAIVYDITLPPLDMAAILVHELNHLVRDKFGEHTPETEEEVFIEVFSDEFMASTLAGFSQLQKTTSNLRYRNPTGRDGVSVEGFPNLGDGTLFNRKSGNLRAIWKEFLNASYKAKYEKLGYSEKWQPNFEGMLISRQVGLSDFVKILFSQNLSRTEELLNVIYEGYFPESDKLDTPNALEKMKLDSNIEATLLGKYSVNLLEPLLSQPSTRCEQWKKFQSSPLLKKYVGKKLGIDRGGEEGIRPTKFGFLPAMDAFRPCVTPSNKF